MFSMLAILVYLAAMAFPAWLLYRLGSEPWYWHVLAVVAALILGLVPSPDAMSRPGFDLITGFVFVFLMVWGIGGLFTWRSHREKHA